MAKKLGTVPLGRTAEFRDTLKNHERIAVRRATSSWDADFLYQEWPSRKSLAKTIRMQQRNPDTRFPWTPLVPLNDGEGY